ncbi:MAG: hypothetical protein V1703_00910 [Candidatus Altiarchaeota archaeon]
MKNLLVIIAICSIVCLSCCTQSGPRCSPPYMEYGDMGYCCLDANQNNICDKYEKGVASTNTQSQVTTTFTTTLPS